MFISIQYKDWWAFIFAHHLAYRIKHLYALGRSGWNNQLPMLIDCFPEMEVDYKLLYAYEYRPVENACCELTLHYYTPSGLVSDKTVCDHGQAEALMRDHGIKTTIERLAVKPVQV